MKEQARQPEDLAKLFIDRANKGDVEGVVSLYEANAVIALPPGQTTLGRENIRRIYEHLLADRPRFEGKVQSALIHGDWALTSTQFSGGATAEVAHRQSDGNWLWVIDQPNIFGQNFKRRKITK